MVDGLLRRPRFKSDVMREKPREAGMFMIDYKDLSWWYWLVTACLLTAGVAGYPLGFALAIGLTVFSYNFV